MTYGFLSIWDVFFMLRILLFARFLLELFQSSNGEMEVKQGDIWGLFREAQQSKSSISFFFCFLFWVLVNFIYMYSDFFF